MAGVYISYPFCGQKCTYCNFASGVFPRELETAYVSALAEEIARHRWTWVPETIYLGGGTPSLMSPEALESALHAIPGQPWREATIEAAPGSVSPNRAAHWRHAGITRVSLGVQSFVQKELARTGRKHTAEVVEAEIALLRAAGICEINIDLIAGLPFQTPESWQQSLDWIARLNPEHVSVYMLEVDGDSRLGSEILAGGARYGASNVPSEQQIVEMYETAVERLAGLGLARYEISNFASRGHESRHNLKYWRLEPYIGFGADAHSFDGVARWQNVESPAEYVERIRRGDSAVCDHVPAKPQEEKFFVGLRLSEGVSAAPEDWDRFGRPIRRFLDEGLLAAEGSRLRLTSRGVLLSNEVFEEFVEI